MASIDEATLVNAAFHPTYTDKKVLRPNFPRVTLTKIVQWPILNNFPHLPLLKNHARYYQLFRFGHCTIFVYGAPLNWNGTGIIPLNLVGRPSRPLFVYFRLFQTSNTIFKLENDHLVPMAGIRTPNHLNPSLLP